MRDKTKILLGLGLLILWGPAPAWAYVDPGSGSYLLQLLIAGFLGGWLALRVFWKSIMNFFRKIFRRGR